MTDGPLLPVSADPQLPAFATTAWSAREVQALERWRRTPPGGGTKVMLAGNRAGKAVQSWSAIEALDDVFQRRYWWTTKEIVTGEDVVVKLTFVAELDGGGRIVREVYGGRHYKPGDRSFVVGGSRLADALKAAEADAIKKLCAMLGMFQDVYRKTDAAEESHHARTLAVDSARNSQRQLSRAAAPADPRKQLIASAKRLGVTDWEGLHELLRAESLNDLADHLVSTSRAECRRDPCPFEHGVTDRDAAYRALAAWVKAQPEVTDARDPS
jgi:hypothetical protein